MARMAPESMAENTSSSSSFSSSIASIIIISNIPDNRDTPLLRKDNCVLAFNEVLGGVD